MLTAKRALAFLKSTGQMDNSDVLEMARFSPPAQARDSFQSVNLSTGGGGGLQTGTTAPMKTSGQTGPATSDTDSTAATSDQLSGKESDPATSGTPIRDKIADPNSLEERLKTLERDNKTNWERNQQLENRLKEVEPKPFYEPTPDGGGVIHLPTIPSAVIGGVIGGLGGPVAGGIGAGIGAGASQIPIEIAPVEAEEKPYGWGTEQGTD